MKQLEGNQIIVGPVRLSYMNAFNPRRNDNKDRDEYSATLLFPKAAHEHLPDPKSELVAINAAIEKVLLEKFKAKPPVWESALKDGDKTLNQNTGEPKHPGYWYMNATAKAEYRPALVNRAKNEAKEEDGWVSGDWGYVKLALFTYDQKGKKGVSCGLRAIQFMFKDEPLGGGGSNADGFDADMTGEAPDEFDPFA